MKKKIFSFVLAFAFILTGSIYLAGCGKDTKYYYTVEMPKHCQIVFQGQTWDDNGYYVLKDESIEFHINVEEGYQATDFKLFIDSTEVTPTLSQQTYGDKTITLSYSYSFTPTADFKIKATGNLTKVETQFSMDKSEWYEETNANNSKLFIRFNENSFGLPTEETSYADFVKNKLDTTFTQTMTYGDSLSFDVYYKGTTFSGNPAVADGPAVNCTSRFYHENGEIGYHFTYTQGYADSYVEFNNYSNSRVMYIIYDAENHGTQNELSSEKLDITLPGQGSQIVTITLKNYENLQTNMSDMLAQLKLKINGENQNVDFTDASTSGVFEITLKSPWEYPENHDNQYNIDLNFYEFAYFDGIVEQPTFE